MPAPGYATSASITDVLVAIAELRGEVRAAVGQHSVKLEQHGGEIAGLRTELRLLQSARVADPADIIDHEARLRALAARSCVSWKALGGVVTAQLGLLSFLTPLLVRIYS